MMSSHNHVSSQASHSRHFEFEILEPRIACSSLAQIAAEFWWKLNRLRVDPETIGAQFALGVEVRATAPAQPLAWNNALTQSASSHAAEMALKNYVGHQSPVDGRWPNQMARESGYSLPNFLPNDRNDIEFVAAGSQLDNAMELLRGAMAEASDRALLLSSKESYARNVDIGIAWKTSTESSLRNFWSIQSARSDSGHASITGVVFRDQVKDGAYEAYEGISGVTISSGEISSKSDANGIYTLALNSGLHKLNFQLPNSEQIISKWIMLGKDNIQLDLEQDSQSLQVNFRQRSLWTSTTNHLDVNSDSSVSPLDALLVINHLNNTTDGSLPPLGLNGSPPKFLIDTNGDSLAAPIDALLVINKLNSDNNHQ